MKAHELLAIPGVWIKGAYARNACGQDVSTWSPEANQFCMVGAIRKCYSFEGDAYIDALRRVASVLPPDEQFPIPSSTIVRWNDQPERTYQEVLAKLLELDI